MTGKSKIIHWVAGIPAILIVVVAILAFFLGEVYQSKLKQVLQLELKKNIAEEIAYSNLQFSFLKHFPDASFEFRDFYLGSANTFNSNGFPLSRKDTLIRVKKLILRLNWFSVFSNHIKIHSLGFVDGKLNLLVSANESGNYEISMLKSDQDSINSNLLIDLNSAKFENIDLYYDNKSNGVFLHSHLHETEISAKISDKVELYGEGIAWIGDFKVDEESYLSRRATTYKFELVDDGEKYRIRNATIAFNGLHLNTNGWYDYENENVEMICKGDDLSIQSFLSLVPKEYQANLDGFRSNGNFYFDARISGTIEKGKLPQIEVDFGWADAKIVDRKRDLIYTKTKLSGRFFSGFRNSKFIQEIEVKEFKGKLANQGSFDAAFLLSDFSHPVWNLRAKCDLAVEALLPYINDLPFNQFSGNISADIKVSGYDDKVSKGNGSILLEDFKGELAENETQIGIRKAQMLLNGNMLRIPQTELSINNNLVSLGVESKNFMQCISGIEFLQVSGNITSKRFDLNKILPGKDESQTGHSPLISGIEAQLAIRIDTFLYQRHKIVNAQFKLNTRPDAYEVTNYSGHLLNGAIKGNSIVFKQTNNTYSFVADANLQSIDVHELLYSFENFGQDYLCDRHLNGDVNGSVRLSLNLDKEGHYIEKSLKGILDLEISDGALYDFEPLEELSRFIDVDELKEIHFKELKNKIQIDQDKISFPQMVISSSLLNLNVAGWYSLNGDFDYRLQLLLSELLSKKVRLKNKDKLDFTEFDDPEIPQSKLYLKMWGDSTVFQIAYDREAKKESHKEKRKKESRELKSALNKEFGLFKKDTSLQKSSDTLNSSGNKIRIVWDEEGDTVPDPD